MRIFSRQWWQSLCSLVHIYRGVRTGATASLRNIDFETSRQPKTTRPRKTPSKKPTAPKKPAGRKSSYLRRGRTRKD